MKKKLTLYVGIFLIIVSLGSLVSVFVIAYSQPVQEDPPKKKVIKIDTVEVPPQQQRSINIKDLDRLNRLFDSVLIKQDTLIKKK